MLNKLEVTLEYFSICPFSRAILVLLNELKIPYKLSSKKYWKHNIYPESEFPILHQNNNTIYGLYAIIEHYIKSYPTWYLIEGEESQIRTEIAKWSINFHCLVTKILIDEKVIKASSSHSNIDTNNIYIAKKSMKTFLDSYTKILSQQYFLTSDNLSIADIVAASCISTIDFFGEINWRNYPEIEKWYLIIKSRPAMQKMLTHAVLPGFMPPEHYLLLDY